MKKILFIILTLGLLSGVSMAQDDNIVKPSTEDSVKDKTDKTILNNLEIIRKIQQKNDSLREEWRSNKNKPVVAPEDTISSEADVMRQIAKNTHQYWLSDNWNLFGWVTFIIAFVSAFYAIITYRAQKKTEEHTTNAPVEIQLWKLKDLPRHFYRNLVCTCALILKYRAEGEEKKRGRYPSESNLKKLHALPDDIVLPIDIDKSKDEKTNPYRHAHELKLLLRNYNVEVDVASEHLARPTISDESLVQDFDNLLFKPLHLVKSTFGYEKSLPIESEGNLVARTILIILKEHFKKLMMSSNFELLYKEQNNLCFDKLLNNGDIHHAFYTEIDNKKGVDRSLDNLLKYGFKNENSDRYGIKYKIAPKTDDESKKFEFEAILLRPVVMNSLKEMFMEESDKPKEEGAEFEEYFQGITSINGSEALTNFYHNRYGNAEIDFDGLYKHIAPYLKYLNQEEWEFHTLIKLIIAVDSAIEIDRIGMVNFN